MTIATTERDAPAKLLDAEYVVAYHILGILNNDRRDWADLLRDAASGELLIPRSSAPHMHPEDSDVPCMFCASRTRDVSAVSASIIMSVAENRFRDDFWNADPIRRPDQVASVAKNLVIDEKTLEDMFGPHWGLVVAFGYRIEFADAPELVELLRKALSTPEARHIPSSRGRDWTQPARWLVAAALSGKRNSSNMATRLKRQDQVGSLAALASAVSLHGTMDGTMEEWIPVPFDNTPVSSEQPKLRVVR